VKLTSPHLAGRQAAHAITAVVLLAAASACGGGASSDSMRATPAQDAEIRAANAESNVARLRSEVVKTRAAVRAQQAEEGPPAPRARAANATRSAARTSAHGGGPLSRSARRSFARLAARLPGVEGIAVSGVGHGQRVVALGGLRTAIAWSTSKLPVALAAIQAGVADPTALRAAITASDNAAAMRLWAALGSGATAAAAAQAQLRAGGDRRTVVQAQTLIAGLTPFGQSNWRLADQARFTAALPCLPAGRRVLDLMDQVVADQRFGLGSAGVPARFKGGWGPGSRPGVPGGYLDRQLGILRITRKPVAVAIASRPADGSDQSGRAGLTALARWLVAHVDVGALPSAPTC